MFNTKTDIYALGITLLEVFALPLDSDLLDRAADAVSLQAHALEKVCGPHEPEEFAKVYFSTTAYREFLLQSMQYAIVENQEHAKLCQLLYPLLQQMTAFDPKQRLNLEQLAQNFAYIENAHLQASV